MGKTQGSDYKLIFPDKSIPYSQKKEKWHKDYLRVIMYSTLVPDYYGYRNIISESYDCMNGVSRPDEFHSLTQSFRDKEELPALWIDFNTVRGKIELLEATI